MTQLFLSHFAVVCTPFMDAGEAKRLAVFGQDIATVFMASLWCLL